MRRGIFDDLLDMQEESNRFFEEIYRRLALFEAALSDWRPARINWIKRIEALNRQISSGSSRRIIASEQYQQETIHKPQSPKSLQQSNSDYNDYEYSDYNEYSDYYYNDDDTRALEGSQETTTKAIPESTASGQNLPVRITENQSDVFARVELPGLRQGDINVSIVGDTLVIDGKVHKTIPLPQGAEPSQIKASYRNGLLELKLPKQNRKQIPVEFK